MLHKKQQSILDAFGFASQNIYLLIGRKYKDFFLENPAQLIEEE